MFFTVFGSFQVCFGEIDTTLRGPDSRFDTTSSCDCVHTTKPLLTLGRLTVGAAPCNDRRQLEFNDAGEVIPNRTEALADFHAPAGASRNPHLILTILA